MNLELVQVTRFQHPSLMFQFFRFRENLLGTVTEKGENAEEELFVAVETMERLPANWAILTNQAYIESQDNSCTNFSLKNNRLKIIFLWPKILKIWKFSTIVSI